MTLLALVALHAFLAPLQPPLAQLSRGPLSPRALPPLSVASEVQPGDKIYKAPETPKVLGGIKVGLRELVVVTGASSGLGLACAKALASKGQYFVICAVRDPAKMDEVAKREGIKSSDYTAMKLELASFQSVRDFVRNLKAFKSVRPLNHLVCNAAVYLPADPKPRFTDDGFEMSLGVNHLGHFLLVNLLLDDLKKAKNPRVCIVGSITGNTNTIGGGLVYPRANLGSLKGLDKVRKEHARLSDDLTKCCMRRCNIGGGQACLFDTPRSLALRWSTAPSSMERRHTKTPRYHDYSMLTKRRKARNSVDAPPTRTAPRRRGNSLHRSST